MDEHLERDVGVNLVGHFDNLKKLVTSVIFIRLMSVNNINERTTRFESCDILLVFVIELFGSWKVFDLELNMWIVVDIYVQTKLREG